MYGFELAPGRTYVFPQECRVAFYSWEGRPLEVGLPRPSAQGAWPDSISVPPSNRKDCSRVCSEETTTTAYANLPPLLEQMRVRAHRSKRGAPLDPDNEASHYRVEPPRVLVVGPEKLWQESRVQDLDQLQGTHSLSFWTRVGMSLGYPIALHSCALRRGAYNS